MTIPHVDIENLMGWFTSVTRHLPQILLAIMIALVFGLVVVLLTRLLDWRRTLKQNYVFIGLTPPMAADKTPQATKELFSVLHGIGSVRTFLDKLLRRRLVLSLEVSSSKEQGIRYLMRVPEQEAASIQRTISSYLPNVRTEIESDYVIAATDFRAARVIEFAQTQSYAFPLRAQISFEEHDPIAYLTGAMTELAPGEQIALQLVVIPVAMHDASIVAEKIMRNEDLLAHLSSGNRSTQAHKIVGVVGIVLGGFMAFVTDLLHDAGTQGSLAEQDRRDQLQVAQRLKPARSLSASEQELNDSINAKVHQPLFRTEMRVVIIGSTVAQTKQRAKAINAPIAALDTKYQSLRARYNFPVALKARYRLFAFRHRLPCIFPRNSNVFSASEIADIFHFPAPGTATDNLVKSYSRTLPAPLSLKQHVEGSLVIGRNKHHGHATDIALAQGERDRHMYIIGGTGNGKSTLLLHAIIQDIKAGNGVGIIDPHGDLAERLLRHIPKERIDDVIYFNPDDIDYSIGLNMLWTDPNATGSEKIKLKNRTTEVVVEALRKVFSEDGTGGHRIEYVLRNALLTAMTVEGATLFTILKLLRNSAYRKKVVDKLDDENLKDFWNEELGKAGDYQRVKMSAGVTTKIDRFQNDPIVERIMGQEKSTINFDEILDGKIFICNLAKGKIGPDTSALFGTVLLSQIQLAAERRVRMDEADRKPFYLYVDEFQNFATLGFTQMLAESRKYKLSLTMAEQTTSQQEDQRMIGIILANVGTVVCFRTGNPADEQLLLPFFRGFLEPGEINNLPAYNFYARLASLKSQEPVSGETIVLDDKGSELIAKHVIAASRTNYAKKYVAVAHPKAAQPPKKRKSTSNINPTSEQR